MDDISKFIFLNENIRISIKILLKYVPGGPIDNKPALVQVMAWHWTGDKRLSEPMKSQFNDSYIRHAALIGSRTWTRDHMNPLGIDFMTTANQNNPKYVYIYISYHMDV